MDVSQGPDDQTHQELMSFRRKIAITMFSRFEGHRRLQAKGQMSLIAMIVFSLAVIAGSLITLVYGDQIPASLARFISAAFIIVSVNSLAFQLYESGQKYEVRSNNMFLSGTKLAELRNKVGIDYKSVTPLLREEYESIIKSHFENHGDIDYKIAVMIVDNRSRWKNVHYVFMKYFDRMLPLFVFVIANAALLLAAWQVVQSLS